jgi:hypothetical protein
MKNYSASTIMAVFGQICVGKSWHTQAQLLRDQRTTLLSLHMPRTFSAALSPVGRSCRLSPPETVSQKTMTVTSVVTTLASILKVVSHIPDVHRSVLNAACTPSNWEPHSKQDVCSYTDLIGSRSPPLLELVGAI